jgi:hypothetical protein
VDREREPSGDYGYDEAHEETGAPPGHDQAPEPEHPGPAPVRPQDSTGDYGYDEAHGF